MDKQSYTSRIEENLQKLQTQMDELRVKANLASAEAKDKYQEQVRVLQEKQREAKAQLETLKASSGNAWEEMKAGLDNAWDDLQRAFDRAKAQL